jgi:peptidoglycan/LPS O-acetylase OafA/YrhL
LKQLSEQRALYVGVPAACIVAGSCLAEFAPDRNRWAWLVLLGDASYALYLVHSFANRGVLHLTTFLGLDLAGAALLYISAAMIGGVLLAVAIHLVFERPIGTALRQALIGRQDARA